MVRVAVGVELAAALALAVRAAQAQRPAQERERGDDALVAARRGLAEEHRVLRVRGVGADALHRRPVEPAVEARGVRRAAAELGHEELRLVGLVPHRPGVDLGTEAAAGGGREALELPRVRAVDPGLVLRRGRPPRGRPGERELHADAARRGGGEQAVVRSPAGAVGGGVGRVDAARLAAAVGARRHRLPRQQLADAGHPEALDLVERRVARAVVDQLAGRLEGHRLVRRGGGHPRREGEPRDEREQGEEQGSAHGVEPFGGCVAAVGTGRRREEVRLREPGRGAGVAQSGRRRTSGGRDPLPGGKKTEPVGAGGRHARSSGIVLRPSLDLSVTRHRAPALAAGGSWLASGGWAATDDGPIHPSGDGRAASARSGAPPAAAPVPESPAAPRTRGGGGGLRYRRTTGPSVLGEGRVAHGRSGREGRCGSPARGGQTRWCERAAVHRAASPRCSVSARCRW